MFIPALTYFVSCLEEQGSFVKQFLDVLKYQLM